MKLKRKLFEKRLYSLEHCLGVELTQPDQLVPVDDEGGAMVGRGRDGGGGEEPNQGGGNRGQHGPGDTGGDNRAAAVVPVQLPPFAQRLPLADRGETSARLMKEFLVAVLKPYDFFSIPVEEDGIVLHSPLQLLTKKQVWSNTTFESSKQALCFRVHAQVYERWLPKREDERTAPPQSMEA